MKRVTVAGGSSQVLAHEEEERKEEVAPVAIEKTWCPDTFIVNVKFRRNATWQGTVTMKQANKEVNFRSALELIKIMDQAIECNHPEDSKD